MTIIHLSVTIGNVFLQVNKMNTIEHFEIPAKDVNKLKSFYEKLFDWKINHISVGGIDYWTIQTSPVNEEGNPINGINGGMYQKADENNQPVNYVTVKDIDESVKLAEKLGASVLSGKQEIPGVGYFAVLRDPEGNQIALMQH